jgi:hypothetical protein
VLCVGSCLWALPSQALSLKAPEYLKSLMKNPIVVVKILMLYLIINDLWCHGQWSRWLAHQIAPLKLSQGVQSRWPPNFFCGRNNPHPPGWLRVYHI